MFFRAGLLAVGLTLLVAGCSSGGSKYATNRNDDSYDLEAMALVADDLPNRYAQKQAQSFDNGQWAALVIPQVVDQTKGETCDSVPECVAKRNQLDALGRIRSHARIFSWDNPLEHLGQPYQFTAQSTLFVNEKAAIDSMKKFCDLPVGEQAQLAKGGDITPFRVSGIADQSVGFTAPENLGQLGKSVDTVVCFRTGRIVHALSQSSLEGAEDLPLNLSLVRKWLAHVDSFFGRNG